MESKLGDNLNNNAIAQSLASGSNTNNDIFLPKNSVPSIPVNQVPQPVANSAQPVGVSVPTQLTNAPVTNVVSDNFYSLFGYEVPKKTMYLLVGFVVLVAVYLYYTKMSKSKASDEDNSDKEKPSKEKEKKKDKEKSDDKKSKKKSKSKDSSESSD